MKLSEFVRDAITEIAFGVHEAKADTFELVAVVPGSLNGEILTEKSYIEFDIAVSAKSESTKSSTKSGKAGAGITVLAARVGVDGTLANESSDKSSDASTSRICFKVPIYFNAHFRGDAGARSEANFVKGKVAER